MKAITLHEPWATLIAYQVKNIETRSWPAPRSIVGQRIAIHAGKTVDRGFAASLGCDTHPGTMVATAVLAWVARVREHPQRELRTVIAYTPTGVVRDAYVDRYGDFSIGRWLWRLTDIVSIIMPIPVDGHQGFWNWTPTTICPDCGYDTCPRVQGAPDCSDRSP